MTEPVTIKSGRMWTTLLLVGLGLLVLLPNLFTLALVDIDESRCAIIAKTMVQHDDWLAPRLAGKPYFNKPPLFFWLAGFLQKAGIPGPGTGRLVSVLATLLVCLLTCDLATRLWDRRTGILAGLVMLTTFWTFIYGRLFRMDMLLVLCTTFSLWCFLRLEFRKVAAGRRQRWTWFG